MMLSCIYIVDKEDKVELEIDDKSRFSSSICVQQRDTLIMRMNASYDNVDNVSYGCMLDEDGDTTTAAGEGIYDTIPEEDDSDNYYIDIIP